MVAGEGFEPSKSMTADLQSAPFGRSGTPPGVFHFGINQTGAGYQNEVGRMIVAKATLSHCVRLEP